MDELDAILNAWHEVHAQNAAQEPHAVIATVVSVQGSAYRRPGARMLMFPDGSRIGTISGGCLEGDVSKKAWWLTEEGHPVLRVYDTTSEDDAIWEFGLGCNGVVHVLLERTEMETTRDALQFLSECRAARSVGVLATVIRSSNASRCQVGDRLMMGASGVWGGNLRGGAFESDLARQADAVRDQGRSRLLEYRDCEVFMERIAPPLDLTIFGAGHDAIPLVAVAKEVGWRVTVADGRPAYAKAERFPGVDEIFLLPSGRVGGIGSVAIGPQSAVVIMTHNYPQDRLLLSHVLPLCPAYLGILGPKKRTERLLREIGQEGLATGVHAPAGLDIGADTPQLIALSIVAEIQAAVANRDGGMLRLRQAPIYERNDVAHLIV